MFTVEKFFLGKYRGPCNSHFLGETQILELQTYEIQGLLSFTIETHFGD